MDTTTTTPYPKFDVVHIHYTYSPDGVVIELDGPEHEVRLVLPEGQHFFHRLVAMCLEEVQATKFEIPFDD